MSSAEALVLEFVQQQNRPVNAQNVSDALQKHGLKKPAIQKALDAIAVDAASLKTEAGNEKPSSAKAPRVIFKEYGKQRIYMARQDTLGVLAPQEMEAAKSRILQLQNEAIELREKCSCLEKERGALQSSLTVPEMQLQIQQLTSQNLGLDERLQKLRGSTGGISTEERQQIDQKYDRYVSLWRKRKRIFKGLWDVVTENSSRNLKEFQEDLGIETDEDAGCSLADFDVQNDRPKVLPGLKRKGPPPEAPAPKVILKNKVVGPKDAALKTKAPGKKSMPPKGKK